MQSQQNLKYNAREAAYFALLASLRNEGYIKDFLEQWQRQAKPTPQDYHLAQEISYGSARMALALDYYAQGLADKNKLALKPKEKAILRTAIYQFAYMDRVPLYAIVNESIQIAKKHCHQTFVSFLNAILRKLDQGLPALPEGKSPNDLSIRYSYPPFFIEKLLKEYGNDITRQILEAGNKAAPVTVRIINKDEVQGFEILTKEPFVMGILQDPTKFSSIAASANYYIQNVTPATLIGKLGEHTKSPKNILDLCAAPGGKMLAAHVLFPKAKLYANDVSEEKLTRLRENFGKYGLDVTLSCSKGEELLLDEKFDLIILDVPCTNSGVLNKRPEARWRLSEESLKELEDIQLKLIEHAKSLLAEGGTIWYLTCSILGRENKELVKKGCERFNLVFGDFEETVLPNEKGWDGGFACILKK